MEVYLDARKLLVSKAKEVLPFARAIWRMRPGDVVQVLNDAKRRRDLLIGCAAFFVVAEVLAALVWTFAPDALAKFEQSFFWFHVLLILCDGGALYLTFIAFGLGGRLTLLLSAQLLTGALAILIGALLLGITPSISHGLADELQHIHSGDGKDTLFYREVCLPTADEIAYVHDKLEIRSILEQGVHQFTKAVRDRANLLLSDALFRLQRQQAGLSGRENNSFLVRFWPFIVGACATPIAVIILFLWRTVFIWRYLRREHSRSRVASAFVAGFALSLVATYSVADMADMLRKPVHSVDDAREDVHAEARLLSPLCGDFDSMGMW